MRLVEANEHHLIFEISTEQRLLLEHALRCYPVDFEEDPISRNGPEELEESGRLLAEALADSRAENRRTVGRFVREPDRFEETGDGCRFKLQRSRINWLLEVLNDVRVGNWHLLGRPDLETLARDAGPEVTEKVFTMQLCAWFETALLEALKP